MTTSVSFAEAQGADVSLTIGQTKRALEWWSCSEKFRQTIQVDTAFVGREYNLGFDPEIIRPLWDPFYAKDALAKDLPVHPAVTAYREFFQAKTKWRNEVKEECSPDDKRFKAWRSRQIARNVMENGGYDDYIIHTPMAIELTDGCSVGCWFCGVGATKYATAWPYAENQTEWREVLTILREKIGGAAKWGFCYWATDPLDNPEYEKFALDFSDVMGMFPQTTTAQAHKHVERVRKLLPLSQERGCRVNRFSVSTEPFLRQIYEAFTPDELAQVEIVAQMREGTTPKAAAGAFRELSKTKKNIVEIERKKLQILTEKNKRLAGIEDDPAITPISPLQPGTIACVSGFLLNMVKRTIKLISPCRASDQWPLGYIVFAEKQFRNAADLANIVEEMMQEHMPQTLDPEDTMRIHPSFEYKQAAGGFQIATSMNSVTFQRPDMEEYVRSIGRQLAEGTKSASQIAFSTFFEYGVPEVNTIGTLEVMFERGLLVDAKGRIAGAEGRAVGLTA